MQKLVRRISDCHIVRNMPADRFFTELANALDLAQPPFLTEPFKHMLTVLDHVRPYSDLTDSGLDLVEQARNLLLAAEGLRVEESPDQGEIADLMAQGRFQDVFERFAALAGERSESERDLVAWAAIMLGNPLLEQAGQKSGEEAEDMFDKAAEKYSAALEIMPNKAEAHNNIGNVFFGKAKLKQGREAEKLFTEAAEKYETALAIKPDYHETLFNWGNCLISLSELKEGEEADRLFKLGESKYKAALAIKPDKHDVMYNWGNALSRRIKLKRGPEAKTLLARAYKNYEAAMAIAPSDYRVIGNWANLMISQADRTSKSAMATVLDTVEEKLLASRALGSPKAAYDLACVEALRGNAREAADWLRTSKAEGSMPDCAHLASDPDLDRIREDSAFVQALKDIGC